MLGTLVTLGSFVAAAWLLANPTSVVRTEASVPEGEIEMGGVMIFDVKAYFLSSLYGSMDSLGRAFAALHDDLSIEDQPDHDGLCVHYQSAILTGTQCDSLHLVDGSSCRSGICKRNPLQAFGYKPQTVEQTNRRRHDCAFKAMASTKLSRHDLPELVYRREVSVPQG